MVRRRTSSDNQHTQLVLDALFDWQPVTYIITQLSTNSASYTSRQFAARHRVLHAKPRLSYRTGRCAAAAAMRRDAGT